MFVIGTLLPVIAHASVLSVIIASITGNVASAQAVTGEGSIQSIAALKPAMNIDPSPATGGGDITIVDDSALVPEEGPAGTLADIEKPKNATISTYVVREGDTLASIAKLFEVDPNTILWANDLPKGSVLKPGQMLTILPVPGVHYTVKKGDTLASIAKKFNGDAMEIANFNGLDSGELVAGSQVIIPHGEIAAPAPKATATGKIAQSVTAGISKGYYSAPLARYVKTQGIHGYNGIDLGAPLGTSIMASAEGDVIVAKSGGYNGGYGSYVVVQHANGSQTLYAHMSRVAASVGQHVAKGQVIGYVGNSGRVSGPTGYHLHFEIRNGIRNPF